MFLILVALTARARIIDSHQNTLKVGVDSERRFQLFCDVGKLDGGVGWEDCFLTAVHVAFILMSYEQLFSNKPVQTETAEEVCTFVTANLRAN